jgi:hypothetical protein
MSLMPKIFKKTFLGPLPEYHVEQVRHQFNSRIITL